MSMIGNVLVASDAQLATLLSDPDSIADFLDDEAEKPAARALDIDKAWHAIHFLLTGEPWDGALPLGFVVTGGATIGDVDVGYGPARAFRSDEVRAIAAALAPITVEHLMTRWEPEAIRAAELYGVDPDRRDEEAGYVGGHFDALEAFVAAAAQDGLGMIVYLS
ncbi:MAG: YfbM family protein [Kofleriaceae bacterium]|nr:YfbM family protein [Myxococcales bacterium]MCB9562262.1 YfbM family protein [Kofleriaceae bacterium]